MKLLFIILSFLYINNTLYAKDIYVAPNGSDDNPGTLQKPLASLTKAQTEAKRYKEAVTIWIRGGTYLLSSPLTFTQEDSRTAQAPLIWKAYHKEQVIISSNKKLALQWTLYKNGIFSAAISDSSILFDALFINGRLQHMARYPDYKEGVLPYGGTAADAIDRQRVRSWQAPEGGYVHAMHSGQWGDFAYKIIGKTDTGGLVLEGGWQNNRPSAMHKQYRYVENIFEELDREEEWYFDHKKMILYVKPKAGISLPGAVIETPQLETLVAIKGSIDKRVKNISFTGLTFTGTLRTFMKNREPLLRSDWTIYRSGAITIEGAEGCRITDCTIRDLGGNAVVYSNYNRNNSIAGCHIFGAGSSGIVYVGNPAAVRSPAFQYSRFVPLVEMDRTPGPKGTDFPQQCLAYNNLIHDIGTVEKQTAGVQISMSQDITVSYNTIYDVPRAGINVNEGTWGGHLIEYNDVFNTVLETGDHGAFNSWGRDRFWHPQRLTMDSLALTHPELINLDAVKRTVIRNNRFHCDNGWDIDLDDGSSNYLIENNLCLSGGIKLREGFDRCVQNNIILNNTFHPHVWFAGSRDTFRYNIVGAAYLPIRIKDWGGAIDHNFFINAAALTAVQQWKVDGASVAGDPGFIDVSSGNYTVSSSSKALGTGFKNFSTSFGVVSPLLRSIAKKPPLPQLLSMEGNGGPQLYDFLGMKLKNLTTLAERSATGMETETGVLVVEVPPASAQHGVLQPDDVILSFAGKTIANISDLFNARLSVQSRRAADIIILRDQVKKNLTINLKQ